MDNFQGTWSETFGSSHVGKSASLCVCAVLFAHDYPLLSGLSWSHMTRVHFPMGADQVIPLLQPLCLSVNELFLTYLISSKQNVISFP